MQARITIITPSFNQGRYLEQNILSVISQQYPDTEHIIIDGGSTDNTKSVLEKYKDKLAYVVSEPDKGQADAADTLVNAVRKGSKGVYGAIPMPITPPARISDAELHDLAEWILTR